MVEKGYLRKKRDEKVRWLVGSAATDRPDLSRLYGETKFRCIRIADANNKSGDVLQFARTKYYLVLQQGDGLIQTLVAVVTRRYSQPYL